MDPEIPGPNPQDPTQGVPPEVAQAILASSIGGDRERISPGETRGVIARSLRDLREASSVDKQNMGYAFSYRLEAIRASYDRSPSRKTREEGERLLRQALMRKNLYTIIDVLNGSHEAGAYGTMERLLPDETWVAMGDMFKFYLNGIWELSRPTTKLKLLMTRLAPGEMKSIFREAAERTSLPGDNKPYGSFCWGEPGETETEARKTYIEEAYMFMRAILMVAEDDASIKRPYAHDGMITLDQFNRAGIKKLLKQPAFISLVGRRTIATLKGMVGGRGGNDIHSVPGTNKIRLSVDQFIISRLYGVEMNNGERMRVDWPLDDMAPHKLSGPVFNLPGGQDSAFRSVFGKNGIKYFLKQRLPQIDFNEIAKIYGDEIFDSLTHDVLSYVSGHVFSGNLEKYGLKKTEAGRVIVAPGDIFTGENDRQRQLRERLEEHQKDNFLNTDWGKRLEDFGDYIGALTSTEAWKKRLLEIFKDPDGSLTMAKAPLWISAFLDPSVALAYNWFPPTKKAMGGKLYRAGFLQWRKQEIVLKMMKAVYDLQVHTGDGLNEDADQAVRYILNKAFLTNIKTKGMRARQVPVAGGTLRKGQEITDVGSFMAIMREFFKSEWHVARSTIFG